MIATAPTTLSIKDIKKDYYKKFQLFHQQLMHALTFIELVLSRNSDLAEWLIKRTRSHNIATLNLEEAIRNPILFVSLLSHNPGDNRCVEFGLLVRKTNELTTLHACIVKEEYLHQGKHNQGMHWNRILLTTTTRGSSLHLDSPGLTHEPDSMWVSEMLQYFQNAVMVHQLILAFKEDREKDPMDQFG